MTDLSADAPLRFLGEPKSEKFLMDTSTAQTIYKGAGVIIDMGTDAVNVHTAKSITMVSTDVNVGIAAETKSVVAGDPETTEIEVYVEPSIIGFPTAVLTNASAGKIVSMSDTGTLSVAAVGAYPQIGTLFKVEDGYAYVALVTPFPKA